MSIVSDRGYVLHFGQGTPVSLSAATANISYGAKVCSTSVPNWTGFSNWSTSSTVTWPRGLYRIVFDLEASRNRSQVDSVVNFASNSGATTGDAGKIAFPLTINFPTTSTHLSTILGVSGAAAVMDKGQYIIDAIFDLLNSSFSTQAKLNVGVVTSIRGGGTPIYTYKEVTLEPSVLGSGFSDTVTIPTVADSPDNTGYWYPMIEVLSGSINTAASTFMARFFANGDAYRGDESEDGDWTIWTLADFQANTYCTTGGSLSYGSTRRSQFNFMYWSDGLPHHIYLTCCGGSDVTLSITAAHITYSP